MQSDGVGYNSKDFNIVINKKPSLIKPKKDIEHVEVVGRNGSLTIDRKGYFDIPLPYTCTILPSDTCCDCNNTNSIIDNSELINEWLEGSGTLIMSHLPQYEYKVKDVQFEGIDIDGSTGHFEVVFICEPFRYLPLETINLTKGTHEIINPSRLESQPILTVYGTGTVSVVINNKAIKVDNVSEYVTIDSVMFECYEENKNLNNYMTGDYPVFKRGKNIIKLESNGTVEVQWKYK
ncbi:hypothetical protein RS78_00460 [Clostridium tetani]|nr:hypothetical protein KY52_10515 [Clostridium tetani]KGI45325.1 hypothetical protein KY54_04245 [Clostridium tetani]KIG22152.1 hypothetical protein RS78_00460 [Clostridium tetani]